MKRQVFLLAVLCACFLDLSSATAAGKGGATATATATAIFACRLGRVDPGFVDPQDPDRLRLIEPMHDIVIGFNATGNHVNPRHTRVFDPDNLLESKPVEEVRPISGGAGFQIGTGQSEGRRVLLVLTNPQSRPASFRAVLTHTMLDNNESPLDYMFNGRCMLLPMRDLASLNPFFDNYIASLRRAR